MPGRQEWNEGRKNIDARMNGTNGKREKRIQKLTAFQKWECSEFMRMSGNAFAWLNNFMN